MTDHDLMGRALELARQGLGRTAPNPAVGAVVVDAAGKVVAEALHPRAGELHAERLALLAAGDAARGGELYCTLEPCCHQGRTPPCTEIIISSGVRRVWYASSDPDPRCAGQGDKTLRQAGIEVWGGLRAVEADRLNEAYFKHKRTGQPFVTLKLALTLDGCVATSTGHSRWVTGPGTREMVHELRDQADAVLVGSGTVLADDPQLTTRLPREDVRHPLRVVVDSYARTPVTARVLSQAEGQVLVAVVEQAPPERLAALQATGAEVLALPADAGRVRLEALLAELGRRNVMGVLCEGGPTLATALATKGLIDKYLLCYAPKFVGGDGLSAFGPLAVGEMDQALPVKVSEMRSFGDDFVVTAYPCSRD